MVVKLFVSQLIFHYFSVFSLSVVGTKAATKARGSWCEVNGCTNRIELVNNYAILTLFANVLQFPKFLTSAI